MNVVDSGKAGLKALRDRITPQRVVFHHVPKCGGTSVGRALRRRYLMSQATVVPESSFRAFEAFTGRTDREEMLVDVLDLREQMLLYLLYEDVRCVSLHVRFSQAAWERFHETYRFVTILREPVSRFLSHYYWSYDRPGAHARIEEPLEAFLETDRARRLGATYSEYFSGLPKEADIAGEAAVAAAIANLRRFDVVGDLRDTAAFAEDIEEELGVRLRIGHENKRGGARPTRGQAVTPEMEARIRELCAPDTAIWNAARG